MPRPITVKEPDLLLIEPRRPLLGVDLAELWRYRELLYFLAWRDVRIRYKQTLIGIAWAVLQPIVTVAIFTLLFSRLGGIDTGKVAYPLFAFAGLLIWLFTHAAITFSSSSLINNANLVTKIYFPRIIIPLAATLAAVFDLIFSIALFAVLMVVYGVAITPQILLAPLFLIIAFILTAAIGVLLSGLTVRFRDVKFTLPFLLQIWMIASPIFYPVTLVPEKWRLVYALNPLVGLIEGLRSSLFGLPLDWPLIGTSCGVVLVICVVAMIVFVRMEDDFADVI